MRSKSFGGMVCPIAGALEAVGDRWSIVVLRDLLLGISRYDDFRRSSGITNATLADRLKQLEANGFVERRIYQHNPERREYLLTEKGLDLAALMTELASLGDRWGVSGAPAPPLSFVNGKTGGLVERRFTDTTTGEPLGVRDLEVQAGPGADDLVRWRLSHFARRRRAADGANPNSPTQSTRF